MTQLYETEFERNVSIALARRGWQRKDLAKEMGISGAYLTDLLKGRRPSPTRYDQIKQILEKEWGE